MKITDGIHMLEVSANVMGTQSFIHPTLICDKDTVILVDTGFPGQLSQIHEAIDNEGVPFDKLSMILITHQDIDHIGTVSGIKKELYNKVKILSHEEERPFINGEKKPVKLAGLEEKLDYLPDNMKIIYEKLKAGFQSSTVDVDETLADGEELPYCGGIIVIYTPGHTPGHICLYLKNKKILIAGDVFSIEKGELIQTAETTNFDIALARESINRLTEYDIETVICYHGGLYKGEVNKRIAEIVKSLL